MMGIPLDLERFDDAAIRFLAELRHGDGANDPSTTGSDANPEDLSNDPTLVLAAEIASLAQTLSHLDSDIRAFKENCLSAFAAEYTKVAASILPMIAEEGFAAEISQATLRIAKLSQVGSASLSVNPVHHDQLVELLSQIEPSTILKIKGDDAYSTSDASLTWDGGGAEFDLNAISQAALLALERQLESSAKRIDKHDK